MATAVVYQGVAQLGQPDATSQLFAGQRLWFSRSVPQRKWFMQNAEHNGAIIVESEHQADVVLVDHAKKNAAPGTYSYRYVDLSIRNGRLEDLDSHAVGSASRPDRPVGSVRTAAKGGRTAFSEADDQLLWNWVKPYMDAGGAWKGNDIYKQLERHNSRHTFQSWRDRWIKHTQFQQHREITDQLGPAFETQTDDAHEAVEPPARTPETRKSADRVDETEETNIKVRGAELEHQKPPGLVSQQAAMGNNQSSSAQPLRNVQEQIVEQAAQSLQSEITVGHTVDNVSGESVQRNSGDDQGHGQESNSQDDLRQKSVDEIVFDGFDEEDVLQLFEGAHIIVRCDPKLADTAWQNWAESRRKHDWRIWKEVFHSKVLPVWRIEEALEDDVDFHKYLGIWGQDDAIEYQSQMDGGSDTKVDTNPERGPSISEIIEARLESSLVPSDAGHHPEPKKSRKRSYAYSTQSESQSTNLNENDSDIPYRSESLQVANGSLSYQDIETEKRSLEARGETSLSQLEQIFQSSSVPSTGGPSNTKKRKLNHVMSSGQHSQPIIYSLHESSEPEISDTEEDFSGLETFAKNTKLAQLPPQAQTTDPRNKTGSESPLFLSEESVADDSTSEGGQNNQGISVPIDAVGTDKESLDPSSRLVPDNDNHVFIQVPRISPDVQLVDDEENESNVTDASSEHPSSETTSEALQFDVSPELSQAWLTGPESLLPDQYQDVDNDDVVATASHSIEEHSQEYPAIFKALVDQQVIDANTLDTESGAYETAPLAANSELPRTATNTLQQEQNETNHEIALAMLHDKQSLENPEDQSITMVQTKADQKRLSTQNLFQQNLHSILPDDFAMLPPPDDGWDDMDSLGPEMNVEKAIDTNVGDMKEDIQQGAIKPASTTKRPVSKPTNPGATDAEDIDQFLSDQKQLHSTHQIDPKIFETICIKALDATCIDLDLASQAIDSMVQKIIRGKHSPLPKYRRPPLQSRRTTNGNDSATTVGEVAMTKRKFRKLAIDKLVDEILPQENSGVWTPTDDAWLQGANARLVEKVRQKHGDDAMTVRFEFLEQTRNAPPYASAS